MSTSHVPLSMFGPGVIGEEAHAANQKLVSELRHHFGPGVVGEEAPVEAAPAASEPEAVKGLDLSITEMEKQLGANDALFEEFFLGEMARPLPRKGAMRLLLDHQLALPESNRKPEIVAILEERLRPTVTS
jgi:hypothetical protein